MSINKVPPAVWVPTPTKMRACEPADAIKSKLAREREVVETSGVIEPMAVVVFNVTTSVKGYRESLLEARRESEHAAPAYAVRSTVWDSAQLAQ